MSAKSTSQYATLEQYRVALENVEQQPQISQVMQEFGYEPTVLTEGKELLSTSINAYQNNQVEDDETTEAFANFASKREALLEQYKLDRKKARVVFRNNAVIQDKLVITGRIPSNFLKRLDIIKKFYAVALADEEIQNKLARLRVTADELNQTQQLINEVETARSAYIREKGESQTATQTKDQAFDEIADWMSEFFAVAKIAFEDTPQYLESLGKIIKN